MSRIVQNNSYLEIQKHNRIEPIQQCIDIVFASDNNFIKYTFTTLLSLLESYKGHRPLRVFLLLDESLALEHSEAFASLQKIHSFLLQPIAVDAEHFSSIKTTEGISLATYYRLMLHKILPEDSLKVIYLDSDILVEESIDKLYDISFDGNIFAGVEDSISTHYNNKFGMPRNYPHINAGVMLVNVDLMRKIPFDDLLHRYLEINKHRITLGDQQIVNELFGHSIKYLPLSWNVHGFLFEPAWTEANIGIKNSMDPEEISRAVENPGIIHYTYKRKPWISNDHPHAKKWFLIASRTPYFPNLEETLHETSENVIETSSATREQDKRVPSFGNFIFNPLRAFFSPWRKGIDRNKNWANRQLKGVNKAIGDITRFVHTGKSKPRLEEPLLAIQLKQILTERARYAPGKFDPREFVKSLPEGLNIMTTSRSQELDGGYAESVKLIFKSTHFGQSKNFIPDFILLLALRIEQNIFWDCIKTSYLYDVPMVFAEITFFGCYATYFDVEANLHQRRAFGYIFDDLGYYFDGRQPSRMEKILSDPSFCLIPEEKQRCKKLILSICANGITKYNKYVSESPPSDFEIEDECVLVVEQKNGDASIIFAGAGKATFDRMYQAAVKENIGKTIYLKRHPDNIHRDVHGACAYEGMIVLPDDVDIIQVLRKCSKVYTVSSQVGFEAILYGKNVVTFGIPFYAGWGLTEDRCPIPRRRVLRTVEELFYVACIHLSIYVNYDTGRIIELEEAIQMIMEMRAEDKSNRENTYHKKVS